MTKNPNTKKNKSYSTTEYDEKTYNIPLATTQKLKEVRKFMKLGKKNEEDQLDFLIEFFGNYMGEEVIDEMTIPDIKELFTLWGKANEEAGGPALGESSASQDS